jgi:hypothetical protein
MEISIRGLAPSYEPKAPTNTRDRNTSIHIYYSITSPFRLESGHTVMWKLVSVSFRATPANLPNMWRHFIELYIRAVVPSALPTVLLNGLDWPLP